MEADSKQTLEQALAETEALTVKEATDALAALRRLERNHGTLTTIVGKLLLELPLDLRESLFITQYFTGASVSPLVEWLARKCPLEFGVFVKECSNKAGPHGLLQKGE